MKISCLYNSRNKKVITKSGQKIIEKNWLQFRKVRRNIYNGKLLRILSFDKNSIKVVQDIDYKTVVGLRFNNQKISKSNKFKVLSFYVLLEDLDANLIFIVRNSGDWKLAYDMPGGFIQEEFILNKSNFVLDFLLAETLVTERDVYSLEYLGQHDATEILEHMLIFKARINFKNDKINKKVIIVTKNKIAVHLKKIHKPLLNLLKCKSKICEHQKYLL